jgi:outer membrane protein assembly factor BamB
MCVYNKSKEEIIMKNRIRKKGFVVGLMVLFIGAVFVPSISADFGRNNHPLPRNDSGYRSASTTDWWVMFRHDANHSGYSSALAPQTNNVLWTFMTGLEMSGSTSVVDGKVYVGSWDKKIYCLDATTGGKIWDYTTGLEITSSPAIVNGKVYIGSNDGKVYCLDASTGGKLWDYQTGADVVSSPTVLNGNVYVGSRDHKVYCLNAETGIKIWDYPTGDDIISSPAVSDGKVFIGSWDDKVYCLNAETGAWIWDYTTGNDVYSSPAVADNKVYIGSSDYKLYCLDALSGSKLWDYTTGASIESCPAITNGKIYVGSFDNKLYCLNADTGEKIWDFQAGDYFYCSPAVADGKVYAGSFDHKIYCLNAETGAQIWSYTTGYIVWSSPAVAEGKVFIGSGDHKVYCFKNLNTPPNAPAAPTGPFGGQKGVEYTFSAVTTDPDGDQVLYLFDWGDGTNSTWVGPYNSSVPGSASHAWASAGNFSVKAKAKDVNGAESDWSASHSISITLGPVLEIQDIRGGLLKITAVIKNTGDAAAANISWSIKVVGGAWIGKETPGKISALAAGGEKKVSSRVILGFGKTVVTVTAEVPESQTTRSQNGTILLFFIKL